MYCQQGTSSSPCLLSKYCVFFAQMQSGFCSVEDVPADVYINSFLTSPIRSLDELLAYPASGAKKRIKARSRHQYSTRDGKKLLVCHDMRGNYLSDRFNTGSVYDENAFEITNWSEVDIFCYFSHYFVTIPPASWVQACRRHQAQVIGTFITEWDAGKELCTKLFSSVTFVHRAVASLVNIALNHDLDGWLINIENTIPVQYIDNVIIFLQLLTKEMHLTRGVLSQVIWYDAVTTEGKLEWQDTLSVLNKPFFDACDAIFINYTWKECSLVQTKRILEASRNCVDVYYGVDVYGRGTLGGGGFNCCEALNYISNNKSKAVCHQKGSLNFGKVCEENELGQPGTGGDGNNGGDSDHIGDDCSGGNDSWGDYSVALFAPGWLLETQCPTIPDIDDITPLAKYECIKIDFINKSHHFWDAIACTTKRQFPFSPLSSCTPLCLSDEHTLYSNDGHQNHEDYGCGGNVNGYKCWGTGFSSSSGLSVYIAGKQFPHWPTVDNPIIDTDPATCVHDATSCRLPPPPYYDLSLQDMNWNLVLAPRSTKEVNNTSATNIFRYDESSPDMAQIQLCDDFGWEGTGCLKFSFCFSANQDRMAVEIPLRRPLYASLFGSEILEPSPPPPPPPPQQQQPHAAVCHRQELHRQKQKGERVLVKTTECRSGAGEIEPALKIDILCYLIVTSSTISLPDSHSTASACRQSTTVPIIFSFQNDESNVIAKGPMSIEFCDAEGSTSAQCLTIQCNSSFRAPSRLAGTASNENRTSSEKEAMLDMVWEECCYMLPTADEYLPIIQERLGLSGLFSHQLIVAKALICPAIGTTDPYAAVYLGTFSVVYGDGVESLVTSLTSSKPTPSMYVQVDTVAVISEVAHCVQTQRLGATIEWVSLTLHNSVDNTLHPIDSVNLFAVIDHSLAFAYIKKIVDLCGISLAQVKNNGLSYFVVERCNLSMNDVAVNLENACLPLGSTRNNSCRVNMLPQHGCTWAPPIDLCSYNDYDDDKVNYNHCDDMHTALNREMMCYVLFLQPLTCVLRGRTCLSALSCCSVCPLLLQRLLLLQILPWCDMA